MLEGIEVVYGEVVELPAGLRVDGPKYYKPSGCNLRSLGSLRK